jgi:DNA-binding NarL/FixJ family response regulator
MAWPLIVDAERYLKWDMRVNLAVRACCTPTPSDPGPTAREIEIIQLLAQGRRNREIADELGISVRTVEAHRLNVMRKLRVRSLIELVYYAMDHGFLPKRSYFEPNG